MTRSGFLILMALALAGMALAQARAQASAPATAQKPAPLSFKELSTQAVRAQRDGRDEEAIRLYLKALYIQPRWAEGWSNVGMLLADRRDFARAHSAFRNLLEIEPENATGWAMLGLTEYEQGRLDDALRDLQHGRSLGIKNADLAHVATYHAALILLQKGECPAASSLLAQLAKAEVDDPDLVTTVGLAALCIATTPDKLEAAKKPLVERVGRIQIAAKHATVDETTLQYEMLLAQMPPTPGLHYAFGNFLADAAHYERALEEMQAELNVNPTNVLALLQLALTNDKLGRAQQGLPYAEKAARLAPSLYATHYALGWTLSKLRVSDRAITELEQAVKIEPGNAAAHYALAEAYLQAQRRDDAMRERKVYARLKQSEMAKRAVQ